MAPRWGWCGVAHHGNRPRAVGLADATVRGREVAPRVRDYDREEQLPRDILAEMADLGFMGGTVPEELGGAGLDHETFAMLIEEVSRVDHCIGVLMSMPSRSSVRAR